MKLQLFSYPSVATYVGGAQKNRLIETVLLSIRQHMFWLRNKKIIFNSHSYLETSVTFIDNIFLKSRVCDTWL